MEEKGFFKLKLARRYEGTVQCYSDMPINKILCLQRLLGCRYCINNCNFCKMQTLILEGTVLIYRCYSVETDCVWCGHVWRQRAWYGRARRLASAAWTCSAWKCMAWVFLAWTNIRCLLYSGKKLLLLCQLKGKKYFLSQVADRLYAKWKTAPECKVKNNPADRSWKGNLSNNVTFDPLLIFRDIPLLP
jgi:hypothetical protein